MFALAPSSADAASCAAKGSETLAENSVARVYRNASDDTIACSKANGRRELVAFDSYEYIELLTLRGHFTAYVWHACDETGFGCVVSIHVRDVRRKGTVDGAGAEAEELVLRSNGSFAWSERDYRESGVGGYVYRRTRRGTTRLDAGPGVDPLSLRLRGNKLSWVSDGKRRRATLR